MRLGDNIVLNKKMTIIVTKLYYRHFHSSYWLWTVRLGLICKICVHVFKTLYICERCDWIASERDCCKNGCTIDSTCHILIRSPACAFAMSKVFRKYNLSEEAHNGDNTTDFDLKKPLDTLIFISLSLFLVTYVRILLNKSTKHFIWNFVFKMSN